MSIGSSRYHPSPYRPTSYKVPSKVSQKQLQFSKNLKYNKSSYQPALSSTDQKLIHLALMALIVSGLVVPPLGALALPSLSSTPSSAALLPFNSTRNNATRGEDRVSVAMSYSTFFRSTGSSASATAVVSPISPCDNWQASPSPSVNPYKKNLFYEGKEIVKNCGEDVLKLHRYFDREIPLDQLVAFLCKPSDEESSKIRKNLIDNYPELIRKGLEIKDKNKKPLFTTYLSLLTFVAGGRECQNNQVECKTSPICQENSDGFYDRKNCVDKEVLFNIKAWLQSADHDQKIELALKNLTILASYAKNFSPKELISLRLHYYQAKLLAETPPASPLACVPCYPEEYKKIRDALNQAPFKGDFHYTVSDDYLLRFICLDGLSPQWLEFRQEFLQNYTSLIVYSLMVRDYNQHLFFEDFRQLLIYVSLSQISDMQFLINSKPQPTQGAILDEIKKDSVAEETVETLVKNFLDKKEFSQNFTTEFVNLKEYVQLFPIEKLVALRLAHANFPKIEIPFSCGSSLKENLILNFIFNWLKEGPK